MALATRWAMGRNRRRRTMMGMSRLDRSAAHKSVGPADPSPVDKFLNPILVDSLIMDQVIDRKAIKKFLS
jgi:hypothetical protein